MAKPMVAGSSSTPRRGRKAIGKEARENQLISLAMDLAEQQLRDGTASSQVITEFIKRGSMKQELELEKLRAENKMLLAKAKAYEDQKNMAEVYERALKAMRNYAGQGDEDDYE